MNIHLSSIERLIALQIIWKKKPISIDELASRTNLPPRSIHRGLPQVKRWFAERNVFLINYSDNQYYFTEGKIDFGALQKELESISVKDTILTPKERQSWITLKLLLTEAPIPVKSLAHELGVSYSTVVRDLKLVQNCLLHDRMLIVKRPGLGVTLSGNEQDRREALFSFLIKNLSIDLIQALIHSSTKQFHAQISKGTIGLWNSYIKLFNSLPIGISRNFFALFESITGHRMSQEVVELMQLRLSIILWRVQGNHFASIPKELALDIEAQPIFPIILHVVEKIIGDSSFKLPRDEVLYIALFLAANDMDLQDTDVEYQIADLSSNNGLFAEVPSIVNIIINEASIFLHPWLRADENLRNGLITHLNKTLEMLRLNIPIHNPYADRTWQEYTHICQVAKKCTDLIKEQFQLIIPDDEIAYIALHLAAALERVSPKSHLRKRVILICNAGTATAWLLSARLKSELPFLEIVEILSSDQINNTLQLHDGIDAIISTIPLKIKKIPTYTVSPFLDKSDQEILLKELIDNSMPTPAFQKKENEKHTGPSLFSLLNKETIAINVHVSNWEEAVDAAGLLLLSTGAIHRSYIQAIKEIIVEQGPYSVIAPGVALLHARPEDGARRIGLSLVKLAEPIEFGCEENDPVSLVFCISTIDNRSHLTALSQLAPLIQNQKIVSSLKKAISVEDVLKILSKNESNSKPGKGTKGTSN